MQRAVGIKLSKILSSDYIGKSKVLTAKSSLNRLVTKTNVMVDPDILKWANKGEFIFSTSYFFKNSNIDIQKEMIREMDNIGVACLGIKVKPYLDKLPKELLDLADNLNFPIIEIDYDVAFTDIMTPILQKIYDEQSQIIRKVETIHKDNMEVVLKGGDIKDILKSLSKTMRNPIYVVDHHFEVVIRQSNIDLSKEKKLMENINKFFDRSKRNKLISNTKEKSVFIDRKEIKRLMVPIMVKNNVYGHIITFGINNKLQKFDVLNLESSANVMALEFLKRLSVQEVENKYKTEFFEDLISLDPKRIQKAKKRAKHYNFLEDAHYSVIKIKINIENIEKNKNFLSQIMNKSIYLINLILKDKKRPFLISNKGKFINILIMYDKNLKIDKKNKKISNAIKNILDEKINKVKTIIGIGRSYYGLENIHKSLEDSQKACEAYGGYTDKKIIFYDNLGIYKIFCHDVLKEELNEFYNQKLKALLEYDNKKETNLIETLDMYFEENGNLKKMSEKLYTHYNTILYRMKRIQEILDVDIKDRKIRYNLETALEIHKIFKKNNN